MMTTLQCFDAGRMPKVRAQGIGGLRTLTAAGQDFWS
jgi:hypothetical protein